MHCACTIIQAELKAPIETLKKCLSNKTSVKLHIHHFAGALSPLNMAFILSVMIIVLLNSEQGAGKEEYKCGRCLIGNEGSIKQQWPQKIKKNIRYLR